MKRLLLFAVCGASLASAFAQRQDTRLADDWKFIRRDVGAATAPDTPRASPSAPELKWETVSVPHTWNAFDGQNGTAADPKLVPDGYWRGAGWYLRTLPEAVAAAAATGERRVFARFEAVSLVADVFLDETHLAQHRGGFAAFAVELTPQLRAHRAGAAAPTLRVRADNSRFPDVAPLQGDFTVFGGIYRPVHLIETDAVCLSPLEHGSPGVFLETKYLSVSRADVEARAVVSNGLPRAAAVEVVVEVADAAGKSVATARTTVELAAGETRPVAVPFSVESPRRWHGRRDPYRYAAAVALRRDGREVDRVVQPLGLRTFELSETRGPLLNGEPYPLHGVNRHQQRRDRGWALSDAEHAEDFAIIAELGATTVRLAHYQQAEAVHELCDRLGFVVWEEIPLVDRVSGLPEFAANAREQLTEMILQGYNRPSLCLWGLFNELEAPWTQQPGPRPDALIASLREHARTLDRSRPLVAASWMRHADPLHAVPEAIAFNVYPGWYWGTPEDFTPMLEQLGAQLGGRRVGISEYGAGASPFQHEEGALAAPKNTATRFHPEEWQTHFHERHWAQVRAQPDRLWGTWIWAMFDFAIDVRDEGDAAGQNDKGLVTADRRTRKDAFFFYQANWADAPMVHLAERRLTPRRQATRAVKVYSNCDEVELTLNGRSIGVRRPDEVRIFRWPGVTLQPGENKLEVVAKRGGQVVARDACTLVHEAAP